MLFLLHDAVRKRSRLNCDSGAGDWFILLPAVAFSVKQRGILGGIFLLDCLCFFFFLEGSMGFVAWRVSLSWQRWCIRSVLERVKYAVLTRASIT